MANDLEERLAAIERRLEALEEEAIWRRPCVPPKGPGANRPPLGEIPPHILGELKKRFGEKP